MDRNGTSTLYKLYVLYKLYANMILNFENDKEIDKNGRRKEQEELDEERGFTGRTIR